MVSDTDSSVAPPVAEKLHHALSLFFNLPPSTDPMIDTEMLLPMHVCHGEPHPLSARVQGKTNNHPRLSDKKREIKKRKLGDLELSLLIFSLVDSQEI